MSDLADLLTSLDSFDRKVLGALHEFEYDPFHGRGEHSGRISPVALYLLYAATVPLSTQVREGHRRPRSGPDLHSRVEALKKLGLIQDGARRWPSFGFRMMRDGRFIGVDREHCRRPTLRKKSPAQIRRQDWYWDYYVCFGYCSDLDASLEASRYGEPGTDNLEIMETVIRKFRHLLWRNYYKLADDGQRKKKTKTVPSLVNKWGLCYELTSPGIILARNLATLEKTAVDAGTAPIVEWGTDTRARSIQRKDGFYSPRTVIWRDQEHDCDLTKQQIAFLRLGLTSREIEIKQVMHRDEGIIWKQFYSNDGPTRSKICQFLSRLNKRLSKAKPPLGISFSLRRGADSMSRDE